MYVMIHLAKINASEDEFKIIYESTGLNPSQPFMKAFYDAVFPKINEIRHIISEDTVKDSVRFSELEWRLSMVTATRTR